MTLDEGYSEAVQFANQDSTTLNKGMLLLLVRYNNVLSCSL